MKFDGKKSKSWKKLKMGDIVRVTCVSQVQDNHGQGPSQALAMARRWIDKEVVMEVRVRGNGEKQSRILPKKV